MNGIEIYYKISNDLINNFEAEFNNYYVSYNIKELFNFNESFIKDLDKIIKEKSFEKIKKIYFKMSNQNNNVENIIQIKPIINRNSDTNKNNRYNNFFMNQSKTFKENKTTKNNFNLFKSAKKPENKTRNFNITISQKITKNNINNRKSVEILPPKKDLTEKKVKRPLSSRQKITNNNNIKNETNKLNFNLKPVKDDSILKPNIIINIGNTPPKNLNNTNKPIYPKKTFNLIKKKSNADDIYDKNFIPQYVQYYPSNAREIFSLQIGKTGMEVGLTMWELFLLEHNIQPDGVKHIFFNEDLNSQFFFKSFFNETAYNTFIPRCLFIDTDPNISNDVRTNELLRLFPRENFVFGLEESSNLYSCRYTEEGKEIVNISLDRINHFLECCDSPQGFLIFNSISGGTGSGLGSLLLEEISNNFPKKNKFCFSIYPSTLNNTLSLEKINSILSISSSLKYSDMDFIFQNDAIKDILFSKFHFQKFPFIDIDRLIAWVISSITCPLRFYDNVSMAHYINWLIPFPRLHFLLSSHAPLCDAQVVSYESFRVEQITNETFYKNSMLANCREDYNKFISSLFIYKGDVLQKEVSYSIPKIIQKKNIKFGNWSKNRFQCFISQEIPKILPKWYFPYITRSVCRISNIPGINIIFNNLLESYNNFPNSNFVGKYINEGMEEMEIKEAVEDLNNLRNEYEEKENEIIGS